LAFNIARNILLLLRSSLFLTSMFLIWPIRQFDRHIASSSSLLLVVRSLQSYTVSRKKDVDYASDIISRITSFL